MFSFFNTSPIAILKATSLAYISLHRRKFIVGDIGVDKDKKLRESNCPTTGTGPISASIKVKKLGDFDKISK